MLHELGILFNVDDLAATHHRAAAWKIFMRTCDPNRLNGSTLYEGETYDPWHQDNVYCIAIQSHDHQIIDYVKAAFTHHNDPALLPLGQRFLEGDVTLRYALPIRARIDNDGQFCSWREASIRQDQTLCDEAGWGFGGAARASYTAAAESSIN
jgi:hypothetical protein